MPLYALVFPNNRYALQADDVRCSRLVFRLPIEKAFAFTPVTQGSLMQVEDGEPSQTQTTEGVAKALLRKVLNLDMSTNNSLHDH